MGTLVAVRTGSDICLAADALNLLEEVIHPNLNASEGCILRAGESLIGLNCSYSFQQAVEAVLASHQSRTIPALDTRAEVRRFFQMMHDALKVHHQLVPLQSAGAFESYPMNALVVNRSGIFKVDSSRAVYEFKRYWALGSGEAFALGALHASYGKTRSAEELARTALAACAEFEGNRGRNVYVTSLRAPTLSLLHPETDSPNAREPISIVGAKKRNRRKKSPQ